MKFVCRVVCLFAAIWAVAFAPRWATGTPTWKGLEGVVHGTAAGPMEIEFAPDGSLCIAQGATSNSSEWLWRIPAGGGPAQILGSQQTTDPDGIDVYAGYAYSAGTGDVYRTNLVTNATGVWADLAGSRNMTTLVIDEAGDYWPAGTAVIGSARQTNDLEVIDATTQVASTLVASADLNIPRGLLFAQGQLYCVESSATKGVWQVSATGVLMAVNDGGHAWSQPEAMVYDPSADAMIVGDGSDLFLLPRTGGTVQQVGEGFGTVTGLTFGPGGALFVADGANDVVWRMPVPEPGTLGMCAMGALVLMRRRAGRARGRRIT